MIDHYAAEVRGRPYCPGCRWILGAATALGIVGLAGMAWGQPVEPEHTLVIHACRKGECKTISFPVPNCTAGGQAWIIAWQANNPMHTLRAWKCVNGEVA